MPEFGVLKEKDFGAVLVELDLGAKVRDLSGNFYDAAGAEAVVFNAVPSRE